MSCVFDMDNVRENVRSFDRFLNKQISSQVSAMIRIFKLSGIYLAVFKYNKEKKEEIIHPFTFS